MAVMTPVIASREMIRTRPDGVKEIFIVEIGTPAPTPSDAPQGLGAFYTPARILGVKQNPAVYPFYGRDSVEALQNAMTGIGTLLGGLPYAEEFDKAGLPNFGFPVSAIKAAVAGLNLTAKQEAFVQVAKGQPLTAEQQAIVHQLRTGTVNGPSIAASKVKRTRKTNR